MNTEPLAAERRRALDALAGDQLTSAAVARRLRETDGEADESLLFPALHGLEASGRLTAAWLPDAGGVTHRTYRRRRRLFRRLGL